jgi:hypothetical protein
VIHFPDGKQQAKPENAQQEQSKEESLEQGEGHCPGKAVERTKDIRQESAACSEEETFIEICVE